MIVHDAALQFLTPKSLKAGYFRQRNQIYVSLAAHGSDIMIILQWSTMIPTRLPPIILFVGAAVSFFPTGKSAKAEFNIIALVSFFATTTC